VELGLYGEDKEERELTTLDFFNNWQEKFYEYSKSKRKCDICCKLTIKEPK